MHIVDITTMANYFGRMTGIARVENQVATEVQRKHPEDTSFVYWSNDKSRFEYYDGELDFVSVKASKMSLDYACSHSSFTTNSRVKVDAEEGRFIVTGSGWMQNRKYTLGCIAFAREHDLDLMFYMYDLVPVKFPYYYDQSYVQKFTDSLTLIAKSGGLIACISENTERDFLEWCATQNIPAPPTVIAYLGDDITTDDMDVDDTDNVTEDGNYVLAVGAIHRRKNYELLVSVWRRLHARMGGRCPKLKIVGGVTPDGKMLANEIESDPVLRNKIEVLTGIDDQQLHLLYNNALLVAYPSHYEGWGLPVAEALAYGQICIASNASAIPEIADLGADSLDPDDPVSWANRILFYAQNPQQRERRRSQISDTYTRRSWADTVNQIEAGFKDLPAPTIPALYLGELVDFSNIDSEQYIKSPCYGIERWGRWITGARLKLRFALSQVNTTTLVLRLSLNMLSNASGRLIINGVEIDCPPLIQGPHDYNITLPKEVLGLENTIEVLSDAVLQLPDKKVGEHAKRYSTIGIVSFGIFTLGQIQYELEDSFGDPSLFQEVGLDSNSNARVICGQRVLDTVKARNGTVSLQFTQFLPLFSDLKAVAFFALHKGETVFVTVRQNGRVIKQTMLQADIHGRCGLPITIKAGLGQHDVSSLEFFLMDEEIKQKKNFELSGLFLPQTTVRTPALSEESQERSAGEYLKFGADVPDMGQDIFVGGWNLEERFGVACSSSGLIHLYTKGPAPIRGLRLNCKVVNDVPTPAVLLLNGKEYSLTLTDEMATHDLNLPEAAHPREQVSLLVSVPTGRFVLRSIHLL